MQQPVNPFLAFVQTLQNLPPPPQQVQYCKMVFLVRADLKMTVGKMCAQCGHCVSAALEEDNPRIQTWKRTGEKKVALKVDSLYQLEQLLKKAAEK